MLKTYVNFINMVPPVSSCSTVRIYFNFFLSCILLSAFPSTTRKGSEVEVSGGTDRAFGRGVGGQSTGKLNIFVYSVKCSPCHISVYNYKCVNIGLFPSSSVFYIFIFNESDWFTARWRWSISPSCSVTSFYFCRVGLSQIDYLSVITTDTVKWLQ